MQLFKAGEKAKRKRPDIWWTNDLQWNQLPSESMEMWDSIAQCAYMKLRK